MAVRLLSVERPDLIAEILPEDNPLVDVGKLTLGSNAVINWTCSKDASHKWPCNIYDRARAKGCPYCIGKRASSANNLLVKNPEIAGGYVS